MGERSDPVEDDGAHFFVGSGPPPQATSREELAAMGEAQAERVRDREMLDYLHGAGIGIERLIAIQREVGALSAIVRRMARHQALLIEELAEAQETAARLAAYHEGLFFRLAGALTPGARPLAPPPAEEGP